MSKTIMIIDDSASLSQAAGPGGAMFRIVRSTHEGETAWSLGGELTSCAMREAKSLRWADPIGLKRECQDHLVHKVGIIGDLASTSEEVNAQALELQSMMGFSTLAEAPAQRSAPARRPAPKVPIPVLSHGKPALGLGSKPTPSEFTRF